MRRPAISSSIRVAAVGCALAMTISCALAAPEIRLEGRPFDLEFLVGKWAGEYVTDGRPARRGIISFTLKAGEDHAHGDVLMIAEGSDRPFERYQGGAPFGAGPMNLPRDRFLMIHFVGVAGGHVYGVLDTYWDPDRQCQVLTRFDGRIKGRVIDGTFVSTYPSLDAKTTGRWTVIRDN